MSISSIKISHVRIHKWIKNTPNLILIVLNNNKCAYRTQCGRRVEVRRWRAPGAACACGSGWSSRAPARAVRRARSAAGARAPETRTTRTARLERADASARRWTSLCYSRRRSARWRFHLRTRTRTSATRGSPETSLRRQWQRLPHSASATARVGTPATVRTSLSCQFSKCNGV